MVGKSFLRLSEIKVILRLLFTGIKNMEIKNYNYIDALRGFAILGVVFYHVSVLLVSPESSLLSTVAAGGARGVQLFYIASALTLFLSMAARKEREQRASLRFFMRRFFRISPLFYLAIIVYTAYDGMAPRFMAPNGIEWWHIISTALFIHGWHPESINSVVPGGWSIAVEMTFYLLVPFLFLKLNNIKLTLIALFLSLIISRIMSSGVVYYLSPYYPDSQQYLVQVFSFFWFFNQLPVFITGILLYHIVIKYPQADKKTALILLLAGLYMLAGFLNMRSLGDLLPQHFMYGGAFLVFSLSLHYSPQRVFVNIITIWIGRLSFSLYLVHFMVISMLTSTFGNSLFWSGDMGFIGVFIIVLFLSLSVSYLTYRLVELPGINLGKRLIRNL